MMLEMAIVSPEPTTYANAFAMTRQGMGLGVRANFK